MSNETDLDWLARTEHHWPEGAVYVSRHENTVEWHYVELSFKGLGHFTKDQWLARRAELQSKPSWDSAPINAEWIAQHSTGYWCRGRGTATQAANGIWYNPEFGTAQWAGCAGEVLGDWRDTLESRPEEFKPSIEEANRLAKEFKLFTSIEDNQELSMSQQQEVKNDNGWFERGELPPAGTKCEFCNSDDEWVDWHHCIFVGKDAHGAGVISIIGDDAGMLYRSGNQKDFRPIRTEHEQLTSIIDGGKRVLATPEAIADAILSSGFSLRSK